MNDKNDPLTQLKIDKDRQSPAPDMKHAWMWSAMVGALLLAMLWLIAGNRVFTVGASMVRAEVRTAENQLAVQKQRLEHPIVRVPLTEVATEKKTRPGEIITPQAPGEKKGQSFTNIVDNERAIRQRIELGQATSNSKAVVLKISRPGETYIDDLPEGLFDGAT